MTSAIMVTYWTKLKCKGLNSALTKNNSELNFL